MNLMRDEAASFWRILITLGLGIALFFATFLGTRPLNNPDESRYSAISHAMVLSGDYVTPKLNGVIFFDKPALSYWIQAGAIQLFGFNNWALRLGSALFAWLGCMMVFIAGYRLFNVRAGLLGAVIAATSLLYFFFAHYINMDMEVAVSISMALLAFILSVHTHKKERFYWLMLMYVAIAGAILIKGLMGLLLPVWVVGLWVLVRNRWKMLTQMQLIPGLLLVILIASPWYALIQTDYPMFLNYFFYFEQFYRYVGNHFNNSLPFYFYITIILLGLFPWSIFIYSMLKYEWKKTEKDQSAKDVHAFLWIWIIAILLFFSVPQSKLVGYILPVFLPFALLFGNYLASVWHQKIPAHTIAVIFYSIFSLGLAIFAFIAAHYFSQAAFFVYALWCVAILFILAASALIFFYRSTTKNIFIALTCSTLIISWAIIFAAQYFPDKQTIRPYATYLQSHLTKNSLFVSYQTYFEDTPLYFPNRKIILVANWDDQNLAAQDSELGHFAWGRLHQPEAKQWLWTPQQFWQKACSQKMYILVANSSKSDFETQAHSRQCPMRPAVALQDSILFTNQG